MSSSDIWTTLQCERMTFRSNKEHWAKRVGHLLEGLWACQVHFLSYLMTAAVIKHQERPGLLREPAPLRVWNVLWRHSPAVQWRRFMCGELESKHKFRLGTILRRAVWKGWQIWFHSPCSRYGCRSSYRRAGQGKRLSCGGEGGGEGQFQKIPRDETHGDPLLCSRLDEATAADEF